MHKIQLYETTCWLIPFGGCKPRQDDKVLLKATTLPLNFWEVTGVGKVNCGNVRCSTVLGPLYCHLMTCKICMINYPTDSWYHHMILYVLPCAARTRSMRTTWPSLRMNPWRWRTGAQLHQLPPRTNQKHINKLLTLSFNGML